jgi:hypothetical protein
MGGGGMGGGGMGGGDAGAIDSGTPLTADQFCDAFLESACDFGVKCWVVPGKDACKSNYGNNKLISTFSPGCGQRAKLDAGAVTFNASNAQKCLDAIPLATCKDAPGFGAPECSKIFIPNAKLGGACEPSTLTGDCVEGYCPQSPAGSGPACYACVPHRAPGETCDTIYSPFSHAEDPAIFPYHFKERCDLDAGYCSTPDDAGVQRCVVYQSLGQPCSTSQFCDSTTSYCPPAPADGGARICAPRIPHGAACDEPTICYQINSDPIQCRNHECSENHCSLMVMEDGGGKFGTCGARARGTSCGTFRDCEAGDYCMGATGLLPPVAAGTCTQRVPAGGACTPQVIAFLVGVDDGCPTGMQCLNNVCVSPPAKSLGAGAQCRDNFQCQDAFFCLITDSKKSLGTCTARLPVNAACDSTIECIDGLACKNSVCAVRRGVGMSCVANNPSQPDRSTCDSSIFVCLGDPDAGYQCQAKVGAGGPCQRNEQCFGTTCRLDAGVCASATTDAGGSCDSYRDCRSLDCRASDGGQLGSSPGVCAMACF